MKRLGLTFVAAFCLAAMTFAAGNQPTTAKWEGNINVNKLSQYLNLNSVQSEEVSNICEYSQNRWDVLLLPEKIRKQSCTTPFTET